MRYGKLTHNVFELEFETDRPMPFEAGQYVSIIVPMDGKKPLRRAYSIASSPDEPTVTLCIQKIDQGPGSEYLAALRAGDMIEWMGPYGHLVYHPKPCRQAVFIGTGTGVAPLRSIVLSEKFRDKPPARTHFLLGVRTESEILYHELSDQIDVRWIACLSKSELQSGLYYAGRVTDYLRSHTEQIPLSETEFYLCGNGAMIEEVKNFLTEHGVEKVSIHQEIYFKPPKSM